MYSIICIHRPRQAHRKKIQFLCKQWGHKSSEWVSAWCMSKKNNNTISSSSSSCETTCGIIFGVLWAFFRDKFHVYWKLIRATTSPQGVYFAQREVTLFPASSCAVDTLFEKKETNKDLTITTRAKSQFKPLLYTQQIEKCTHECF